MRIRTAGVVVTVTMALVSAGCTGGNPQPKASRSPSPAGTVTIWAGQSQVEAIRAFGARYRARTGVDIQVRAVDNDPLGAFLTANRTATRPSDVPDIVLGSHDWISALVRAGAVEPVPLTGDQRAGFADLAIRAVTHNGQVYGVPYGIGNLVLYRNTELVPDAPRTFEEAVAVGRQLTRAGRARQGIAWPVGAGGHAEATFPMYTSAGGYLFGSKAGGDIDLADLGLRKPEAVTAFQKIATFGELGSGVLRREVTPAAALATFVTSGTPYLVAGPEALPEIKRSNLNFDVSPVPSFFGGRPAQMLLTVPTFFVASRGANRALAQRFVTASLTTADLPAELYGALPVPPALTAALERVRADDPSAQKLLDSGRGGVLLPAVPRPGAALDPIARLEAAVLSGADVPAAVASAAAEIEAGLA